MYLAYSVVVCMWQYAGTHAPELYYYFYYYYFYYYYYYTH